MTPVHPGVGSGAASAALRFVVRRCTGGFSEAGRHLGLLRQPPPDLMRICCPKAHVDTWSSLWSVPRSGFSPVADLRKDGSRVPPDEDFITLGQLLNFTCCCHNPAAVLPPGPMRVRLSRSGQTLPFCAFNPPAPGAAERNLADGQSALEPWSFQRPSFCGSIEGIWKGKRHDADRPSSRRPCAGRPTQTGTRRTAHV